MKSIIQSLVAEIEVTNTSNVDGKETAMWFIADPAASISRLVKELKYFEKKPLKAGEKTTLKFVLDPIRDLCFPDANGIKHLQSCDFHLTINNQKITFELID